MLLRCWPGVKVFRLVENVASMTKEAREVISRESDLKPIFIEAGDVTRCRRPRYS